MGSATPAVTTACAGCRSPTSTRPSKLRLSTQRWTRGSSTAPKSAPALWRTRVVLDRQREHSDVVTDSVLLSCTSKRVPSSGYRVPGSGYRVQGSGWQQATFVGQNDV